MADRDTKIERAREALREKEQEDQVEAEREEPEGRDRADDERPPDPHPRTPGEKQQ
jgi:hypothetical protein